MQDGRLLPRVAEHATTEAIMMLCRDCLTLTPDVAVAGPCRGCNSARTLLHPRLAELTIAHIDCDAFFAAIEKRDNPGLKDKPVIVGGGTRGVVSTCCYIARLYGVRSAMPMFKALALCPDAVVVRSNFAAYGEASRAIREKMLALTPLVQAVSIDEAYLDLSGTAHLHGGPPAQSLARLAAEIERDVGITVSIGLSANKFLAKTASELDKPRGFAVIAPEDAARLLGPHPPGFLHGVGPKFAETLLRDGFPTVAHIQRAELKDLIRRYGESGLWLHQRAHGIDTRPVHTDSERKSISNETTFNTDIRDLGALEDQLWKLCVKTADRAKALGLEGAVVTLKLKNKAFKTITRRTSLTDATQLAQTLFRSAKPMLAREADGTAYRLIGIGLSALGPARGDAQDLLDPSIEKRARAERAADTARAKFGGDAVFTGRAAKMVDRKKQE